MALQTVIHLTAIWEPPRLWGCQFGDHKLQ